MKPLDKITLRTLIKAVVETHDDEIDCNECFEQMSRFAELALEGKSPEKAMPLVQDHLKKCGDCHEEYQTLLEALQAVEINY